MAAVSTPQVFSKTGPNHREATIEATHFAPTGPLRLLPSKLNAERPYQGKRKEKQLRVNGLSLGKLFQKETEIYITINVSFWMTALLAIIT